MKKSKDIFSELPLGATLALLSKGYFGALVKRLEHLEIERYYSVLIVIENSESGSTQQNIADVLKIDKASMVRIIDFLSKKKFIERVVNPDDRREHRIILTSKAVKLMPEIYTAIVDVDKSATKGLTKAELKVFNETLCKINSNLNELPSHKMIMNLKKVKQK